MAAKQRHMKEKKLSESGKNLRRQFWALSTSETFKEGEGEHGGK